jgi:hypothetical protein
MQFSLGEFAGASRTIVVIKGFVHGTAAPILCAKKRIARSFGRNRLGFIGLEVSNRADMRPRDQVEKLDT